MSGLGPQRRAARLRAGGWASRWSWLGLPRHRRAGLAGRVLPYLRDTPRPSRLLDDGRPAGGALGVGGVAPSSRDLGAVRRARPGRGRLGAPPPAAGRAGGRRRRGSGPSRCSGAALGRSSAAQLGVAGSGAARCRRGHRPDAHRDRAGRGRHRRRPPPDPPGGPPRGADAAPSSRPSPSCSPWPSAPARERSGRSTGSAASRSGELAGELRRCLADARAGANLPTALQGLADRTGLASLRRFVDGVVIAVRARHPARRRAAGPGRRTSARRGVERSWRPAAARRSR